MTKNERNQEVVRLQPLVRRIALKMCGRLPASVEIDDLISEGTIGLIDALARFDRSRGVKIENFARVRIRGAILDWLRREDPMTRPQRAKQRAEAASGPEWLEREAVPDVEDLCSRARSQFDLCLASELRSALERAACRLHGREREIVDLYYGTEITQDRIARQIGIDPSRISQLHAHAMERLRRSLGSIEKFLA